jgi:hypothetical protein
MGATGGRSVVAAMLMLATLAASCGGDGAPAPSGSPTAGPRPAGTAMLAIERPTQGQVVHGSTTPLRIRLTGAQVVQATSTTLRPDQGHLHVFLDDALVTMTADTRSELTGLTPGRHILKVEFVANDHAPFDPRVTAAVTFEVGS